MFRRAECNGGRQRKRNVSMNPIRQKAASFLTEAVHKKIAALDFESEYAKQLSEDEDIDTVIAEEIEKISEAATLAEISKIVLLAARLRRASGQKRDSIRTNLKEMAELLVTRVEAESGPLKLPQPCRHILSGV